MSAPCLRPYQLECLDAIEAARAESRSVLCVLPTGCGKTVIFSRLPERSRGRMLVLAHRTELLDQAAAKISSANPALTVALEQAEKRAGSADVVVASVQTIGRKGSPRLLALDPGEFSTLVIDEAHHAVAQSYRTVRQHFAQVYTVGFTATPFTGAGARLDQVFEPAPVFSRELPDMIAAGFLVRLRAYRVDTGTDLAGVRSRGGDFVEKELSAKVDTPERNAVAVAAYQAHAAGRRAIAFTVDVAHAHHLAAVFRARGITAAPVWGDMPKPARREVLALFRARKIQVVTNCGVLTEGFDDPGISAVIMARPTQSVVLYPQMAGRGTRLCPEEGKTDCVLVDLVDVTKLPLVGAEVLYGLPRKARVDGRDLADVAREQKDLEIEEQALAAEVSAEEARRKSEEVDLLMGLLEPDPVLLEVGSPHAWAPVSETCYRLDLGAEIGEFVDVIRQPASADWRVYVRTRRESTGGRKSYPTLEGAIADADAWIAARRAEAAKLVRADAPWRMKPATPDQLRALARQGFRSIPEGFTRGAANDALARVLSARKARSARTSGRVSSSEILS